MPKKRTHRRPGNDARGSHGPHRQLSVAQPSATPPQHSTSPSATSQQGFRTFHADVPIRPAPIQPGRGRCAPLSGGIISKLLSGGLRAWRDAAPASGSGDKLGWRMVYRIQRRLPHLVEPLWKPRLAIHPPAVLLRRAVRPLGAFLPSRSSRNTATSTPARRPYHHPAPSSPRASTSASRPLVTPLRIIAGPGLSATGAMPSPTAAKHRHTVPVSSWAHRRGAFRQA